jgi:hypothetical protein
VGGLKSGAGRPDDLEMRRSSKASKTYAGKREVAPFTAKDVSQIDS